jgi:capsular exopolysaccharide synthesis family protein
MPRTSLDVVSNGPAVSYERPDHVHRPSPSDVVDFGRLFGAMRRNWLRIGIGTAVVVAAALIYLRMAVPRFEATSSIRIDTRASTLPTIYADQSTRDEIFTEIEVLRSRTIAADVVDSQALQVELIAPKRVPRSHVFQSLRVSPTADTGSFRLVRGKDGRRVVEGTTIAAAAGTPATVHGVTFTLDPRAAEMDNIDVQVRSRDEAITELRREVDIGRAGLQASIIALRYESEDPEIARDVLNSWTANFVRRRQSIQRGEATNASAFIQAQLDTLMPQLASAEAKLLAFRNANSIVAPEFEASTQVSQSAQLQATRNELDAERASLEQAVARVRAAAATAPPDAPSPYRDLIGFPTLLRNQAASELLRSLSSLDDQRAQLLMRRTSADPDVITISERIRVVEGQLQALTTTYLRGLTAQVASADASLGTYANTMRAIPSHEIEYARLQRAPQVYAELVSLLQTRLKEAQITEAVTDASVRIVDAAVAPTRPSSPNPPLVLALGLVGGLMFGAALAFIREQGVSAVRSRADLQRLSDTPVLGLIPTFSAARPRVRETSTDEVVPTAPDQLRLSPGRSRATSTSELAAMEAFTRLLLNARWAAGEPIRSLLITSPLPGDGKTTNAMHLAAAAAGQGQRVLLVDADLRCGGLTVALSLRERRGLVDFLAGTASLPECVTSVMLPGGMRSDVVGAGNLSQDAPVSLLASGLEELLDKATGYDLVLVDTSPINLVADAAALAPLTDGVLLVARSGETSPAAIDVALDQLYRSGARVLGTVLNGAEFHRNDGYGSLEQYRAYTTVRT